LGGGGANNERDAGGAGGRDVEGKARALKRRRESTVLQTQLSHPQLKGKGRTMKETREQPEKRAVGHGQEKWFRDWKTMFFQKNETTSVNSFGGKFNRDRKGKCRRWAWMPGNWQGNEKKIPKLMTSGRGEGEKKEREISKKSVKAAANWVLGTATVWRWGDER